MEGRHVGLDFYDLLIEAIEAAAEALFLLWTYQPNLQTKDWWPAVSIVGHPSVATSVQGESLGCDLLAQEVLGFGFFVVPLL
jgi:hypothetical protein